MNLNLQECARKYEIRKFINPISNCSYPDFGTKQFYEKSWWDGPLHSSVLVYGFAKKATWVNAYAYQNQYGMQYTNFLVPNMYGPEDHFDPVRSHALGALVNRIAEAKKNNDSELVVWGTGNPVREWLFIDDCVDAFIRSLSVDTGIDPINIGQGVGYTIKELAEKIKDGLGYKGKLVFDSSKPDGAPYKVMNVERLKKLFGWAPTTSLTDGLKVTLEWYQKNNL